MTELMDLGSRTANVWTRADALGAVKAGTIRGYLLDGVWQSPWPGVYADGGSELSSDQRAAAAVLATARGRPWEQVVLCGRTAARLWGLPLIDDLDPTTGAVDHLHHDVATTAHLGQLRSLLRGPGDPVHVLHRHQLKLTSDDLVEHGQFHKTSVPRTLFELTWLITHPALVCALDAALHEQLVTVEDLRTLITSYEGRRGVAAFAHAVGLADSRAESPAETLTRLLLLPHLPGLVPQVKVYVGTRLAARLDLADPVLKLAVESDGKRWHSGAAMVAKDYERDATTAGEGWWTERVTWWQVRREPDKTLARILLRADKLRARAA